MCLGRCGFKQLTKIKYSSFLSDHITLHIWGLCPVARLALERELSYFTYGLRFVPKTLTKIYIKGDLAHCQTNKS